MKKILLALLLPTLTYGDVLINEPIDNQFYSGIVHVQGIVSDIEQVQSLELSVNNQQWNPVNINTSFSTYVDLRNYPAGNVPIVIRSCTNSVCTNDSVNVFNVQFQNGTNIDLSQAQLDVVDGVVYFNGVYVGENSYVIRVDSLSAGEKITPVGLVPVDVGVRPDDNVTQDFKQTEFVRLIQRVRLESRECGGVEYPAVVNPLIEWDDKLAQAAMNHSTDMANNDYFSHYSLDGSSFAVRVAEAGFQGRPVGENIGAGYLTVADVVEGWLNSPGHCVNIMDSSVTHFGAALAIGQGTEWTYYWTFVTGRK